LEQPIDNYSKPKLKIGREIVKLKGIENTLKHLYKRQNLSWHGHMWEMEINGKICQNEEMIGNKYQWK
jgi:hypothetical protein